MDSTAKKQLLLEFLCLMIICVLVGLACDLQHTIFFRPSGAHSWRQCDGASHALNYYQNHRPFFQPQYHNLNGEDGKGVSEFPIVYFAAAKLYNVFGFHEYLLRGLHGMLFLLGIFYTWLLTRQFTKGTWFALLPPVLLLTSPYIFYYGPNFLPDVPALSLAIASFYYFVRYSKQARTLQLLLFMTLAAMACLIKISAGILPLTAMGVWCLFQLNTTAIPVNLNPALRQKKILPLLLFTIVTAVVAAWVLYAKHYNEVNHNGQNLMGFYGIWDAPKEEILRVFKSIFVRWIPEILSPGGWLVVIVSLVMLGKNWRTLDNTFKAYMTLSFVGVMLYSLGWFRAFFVHDYYMINMFCFPLLAVIGGTVYLERWWAQNTNKQRALLYVALGFVFVTSVVVSRSNQADRYDNTKNPLNPNYFKMEAYLRSIGIDRHQKVIAVPDGSPNRPLYLMNNPGWTENCMWQGRLEEIITNGECQYLILFDSSYMKQDMFKAHLSKQVGYFNGINIYHLRK